MATYSDTVVSIQTGTGTYTCPTGKFARVSLRSDFSASPATVSVAGVSSVIESTAGGRSGLFEVILAAGETIVPNSGTISWTALEYSAP